MTQISCELGGSFVNQMFSSFEFNCANCGHLNLGLVDAIRSVMTKLLHSSVLSIFVATLFQSCEHPSQPDLKETNLPSVQRAQEKLEFENDPAECDAPTDEQSLADYAAECQVAMDGIGVEDFDCEDPIKSIEVPVTHGDFAPYATERCDRPNVLNGKCDRGSRFQVLTNEGDILAVAHCRSKNDGPGRFNDVAVIQYNKRTGDTCFFQSVLNAHTPHKIPSPLKGQGGVWEHPSSTTYCVGCHDNGPFIRSPYLAQLIDLPDAVNAKAVLPGSHDSSWNSSLPYRFVGAAFQGLKTYAVSTSQSHFAGQSSNTCTSCHRMAISSKGPVGAPSFSGNGSTLGFGAISTGPSQINKNAHDAVNSPIWMLPVGTPYGNGQVANGLFDPALEHEASLVRECARSIIAGTPTAGCTFTRFGQGKSCKGAPIVSGPRGPSQTAPSDQKHETTTPLGVGPGRPGFCYFREISGPFFQESKFDVPFSDPDYFGSFLRIDTDAEGKFQLHSGVSPTRGTKKLEAYGQAECTYASEIEGIKDVNQCGNGLFEISDPDGSQQDTSLEIAKTARDVSVLSGLFGNVSQQNTDLFDRVLIENSGGATFLAQHHLTVPFAGKTPGPSKAEAWRFGCSKWAPTYAVQNVFTESDVLLVPAVLAAKTRCFITGITGDWSSTRDDESAPPKAVIYSPANGEVRLKVSPDGLGGAKDRVGAFASCVRIKP
jgi:hypothetical protein